MYIKIILYHTISHQILINAESKIVEIIAVDFRGT